MKIFKDEFARKEILSSAFVIILSLIIVFVFIPEQISLGTRFENTSINSRTFPYITASLMGLFGVINIIKAVIDARKKDKLKENSSKAEALLELETTENGENSKTEATDKEKGYFAGKINKYFESEVNILLLIATFVLFVYSFVSIGSLLTVIIFPSIVLLALKSKNKYHYIIAHIFVVVMWFIFRYVLLIYLP